MNEEVASGALSEQAVAARGVLETILEKMEFPSSVEVTETPQQIILTITSDQPMGLLIGKGGQTLNALELIVRQITQHQTHERGKPLMLDAEGYRGRQFSRLEEVAREAAFRVLETGEAISLEPMSPRDRRTVHMAVAEIEGVETYSVGEEPYRHVVACLPGQKPERAEQE